MTTWNPADCSANVSLSPDNRVATLTSGTAAAVRSTTSKTSGKTYFELPAVVANNTGYGIVPASAALGSVWGSSLGFQCFNSGSVYFNGTSQAIGLGVFASGDIACFAIDLVNARGWVRRNGGNWNQSGTANPATNTGGVDISALFPTNAAFAFASFGAAVGASSRCTFGSTGFEFAVPSGFSGWDAFVAGPYFSNTGAAREVLFTTDAAARVAGLAREVLLPTGSAASTLLLAGAAREVLVYEPPTAVLFSGAAREILTYEAAPPPTVFPGNVAVTINTG